MRVMGEITARGDYGLNSGYLYPKHSGYNMTYRETANTSVVEYRKFDENSINTIVPMYWLLTSPRQR